MPTFQEFQEFDIRVGTITAAERHPTARKASYQIAVDFGEAGVKHSSAQLTERYTPEALIGTQIIGVINFPPRRVADFTSEVLILGVMVTDADVVLLRPDHEVTNGLRIG